MSERALSALPRPHRAALKWFHEHDGQVVPWPSPIDGVYLVNRAKGIHKPAGFDYALSVRQSLNGPYEDAMHRRPDGGWSFQYAQEGQDPAYFTNRGLHACMRDSVPVGVITQVKEKPDPLYRVEGLGRVVAFENSAFTIESFRSDNGMGSSIASEDAGVPEAHEPSPAYKATTTAVEAQQKAAPATNLTEEDFDASNVEDARERTLRSIAIRQGQPAFRAELIRAYGGRCAVSGCDVLETLEAAHLIPYLGPHTNHVKNGVLLRADIHTLFDLALVTIDPASLRICISPRLRGTMYASLEGTKLRAPNDKRDAPMRDALKYRFNVD